MYETLPKGLQVLLAGRQSLSGPYRTTPPASPLSNVFVQEITNHRNDFLADDQSVTRWLEVAGLWSNGADQKVPHGLLDAARELRDCSRAAVSAAMKGVSVDLTVINQVFEAGRPVKRLEWDGEMQEFRVSVHQRDHSPASLLWPVADSLVNLIANDKFEFVRQCEAHDCILLFHDPSESHRRRWCSMATCGNRMKVAAFRSKKPG